MMRLYCVDEMSQHPRPSDPLPLQCSRAGESTAAFKSLLTTFFFKLQKFTLKFDQTLNFFFRFEHLLGTRFQKISFTSVQK